MAHEVAREREVHRFYQPWLETFHALSLPAEVEKNHRIPREDGHIPQSSQDRALTAFAQLGALRLNAQRCVVTLIDNSFQYVLAEATKSLSLMDDARHDPGDELWLGNSRIPRGQGVSEDALYPEEYVARNAKGEEFKSPALVVPDLAAHPRYKDKKFAGSGGISFYAGVPIITSKGHTIGVYTIVDNHPREGLSVEDLHSMVDMATIVLKHLEGIRNERARARGERLIQGIGTFIEGDPIDASLSIESPGPNYVNDPLDAAGRRQHRPQLSRSRESSGNFKGLTIVDANSVARNQYSAQEYESRTDGPHKRILPRVRREPVESPDDPYKAKQKPKSQHFMVFDRAARLMRKCLGADGVAFVDASSANLSKGTARTETEEGNTTSVQHSQKKRTASKPKPQSAVTPEIDGETPGATYTSNPMEQAMETKQLCEIIALTTRDSNSDISMDITEHDLRKLVRRDPQGKAYTFDADGNLATSDDSASEGVSHVGSQNGHFTGNQDGRNKRKDPKKNALHAALPKARTIVFLPLWDFANQRWNAAAVIWSSHPTKMMNVGQDFSYLRAFANSVMNEIARLNLSVSDAAKATFLANISHELRSPLHGILGSIEFLHDTALDDFQSGMVISVETCGKTLLDTVNHVLDFAKLNNLSKQGGNRESGKLASSSTHTPITSTFDLAVVVEEGVEAVYAGQVFRTASQDAIEGEGPALSSNDKAMVKRQRNKDQIALGQAITSDSVELTLNIDDGINWHVTSQPGAVRRIVMNLLGNALKYTPAGSINVALEIDSTRTHEQEAGMLHACITVTDTGKGMSDDFVRNHAFTAFSQEDSLATGTGLGLSIIRSIVDSLGGEIDLRSQKDLGTEVKIWLSLPAADEQSSGPVEKNVLQQVAERTAGMSLCLLSPPMATQGNSKVPGLRDMPTVEDSLRNLLSQWYSLKIFTAPSMEKVEDADFFVYAEPPAIEYLLYQHGRHAGDKEVPVIIFCQNAFQASSLRANGIHHLTEIGRIIEIIAQPVGPQKLARVLQRCLQRSKMLERSSEALSSEHVTLSLNDPDHVDQHAARNTRARESADVTAASSGEDGRRLSFSPDKQRRPQPDRSKSENHAATAPSPSLRPVASPQQRPQQRPQQIPQPKVDLDKPGVLAVDDNQINLQLMVTFVRKTRHPYQSATDGALAVEAYRKSATDPDTGKISSDAPKRFKYILMDINMPNMDGTTATKEIRKFEKENKLDPPVKIFALTGLDDLEQHWATEAGFDRVLSKPIKFKELKDLLV